MSHSATALLPTSSSPRNMMTTLENVVSRTAARSARSFKPDTVAIGDQPTTSSVNSVPGSTEAPPTSASNAFNNTSLRDSLIGAPVPVFWQSGVRSRAERLRLGRGELCVCQRTRCVQLCEVFDLVGRVRRRRRILRLALVVLGRRLVLGLLVAVRTVPVVSNRRSSDERPASCPSPESHENPFPCAGQEQLGSDLNRATDRGSRRHPGRVRTVDRPPWRRVETRPGGGARGFGPEIDRSSIGGDVEHVAWQRVAF